MNLGLEYIKYRWKAKRRHGVHSPFIYDLTDKCFRTPVSDEFKTYLNSLDHLYKSNSNSIDITDFGAGSKKLGNTRTLSSIYKTSSSKGKYGVWLHQISTYYQPKRILEFGTSLGIGTIGLASGNMNTEVFTVEGCPNTHEIAKQSFNSTQLSNITSINSTFDQFIKNEANGIYDLIFIDGHHDGDALIRYMELLDPFSNQNTIFILDDIRWSQSMFNAWTQLMERKHYHVSIDLFRMGILIKRQEQEKEHFTIY